MESLNQRGRSSQKFPPDSLSLIAGSISTHLLGQVRTVPPRRQADAVTADQVRHFAAAQEPGVVRRRLAEHDARRLRRIRKNIEVGPPARAAVMTNQSFAGGATVAPPYTWPYTWSSITRQPSEPPDSFSDQGTGWFWGFCASDALSPVPSSHSVAAGFGDGLYQFSPAGLLTLTTVLSPLNFGWRTTALLQPAHTDGTVGFWVVQTDLYGGGATLIVAQQTPLWLQDSYWTGDDGATSYPGFPLGVQLLVDDQHLYAFFVICASTASGQGLGAVTYSSAMADFEVVAPYFTWELSTFS